MERYSRYFSEMYYFFIVIQINIFISIYVQLGCATWMCSLTDGDRLSVNSAIIEINKRSKIVSVDRKLIYFIEYISISFKPCNFFFMSLKLECQYDQYGRKF